MSTAIHVRAPEAEASPVRRSLFRASTVFALASLGAYALALARSSVVARWFGTSAEMDAFTAAFIVPNLLSILLTGSAALALVPALAGADQEGPEERSRTFRGALLLFAIISVAVAFVVFAAAPWIMRLVAPAFDPYRARLATVLLRICSPLLLLNAIFAFTSGELLSRRKHLVVAGAPAISTVVSLVLIVAFGRFGVTLLAYSLVIGAAVQATAVLWAALRANPVRVRKPLFSPRVRGVIREQLPLMAVASFGVVNFAVDQIMAGLLPVGSVSTLNYANTLNGALIQVVAMAASWVVLPEFATLVAAGDNAGLVKCIRQVIRGVARASALAVAMVFVFGEIAIRLAFQHGAFTAESTHHVYVTLLGYTLGLVPCAIGMAAARLLTTLRKNIVLAKVGLLMLPVNVGLDYLLMRRWGTAGIGVSTSVVFTCTAILLYVVVGRRIGNVFDRLTVRAVAVACTGAAAGAWLLMAVRAAVMKF